MDYEESAKCNMIKPCPHYGSSDKLIKPAVIQQIVSKRPQNDINPV